MSQNIVAIAITYHPELKVFGRLLDALARQVEVVVVIDNGSDETLPLFMKSRGRGNEFLISLGTNKGIAVAQNIGINWARNHGANYVLLFDQDSEPASDMVAKLLEVAEDKHAEGVPLAAVGPCYVDKRRNSLPPFFRINGLKVERQVCHCDDTVVEVDYLISSGCLIPIAALNKVGEMQENFFIDLVDTEWGLRARYHGLKLFGVCGAMMHHELGEKPVQFFGKMISLHSALRHYYQFRNAIWMYRQPWLPLNWKLADAWRLLLRYGFYTLFATPRFKHFKMMSLGIWHGLRGKMGPFNIRKID